MKATGEFKHVGRTILVVAALHILCVTAWAQGGAGKSSMTAQEFETWVLQRANAGNAAPATVCAPVIDRLKEDKRVTDRTILRCVEAHIASAETRAGGRAPAFEDANQFMDQVISLLADRHDLAARLFTRKASLAAAAGDNMRAAQLYEQAVKALEPVRLDVDLQRVTALVRWGQSLLAVGRKSEADSAFLLAMSYPWYTVTADPEAQSRLRDQYLAAGFGLIEARRGNLPALQQITFVPALAQRLGPRLAEAIREAGGKAQ